MATFKIFRLVILTFMLTVSGTLVAQWEPRVCTFDKLLCSFNEFLRFTYTGNECNCCNPTGAGVALVDKYAVWGFCSLYFTTYEYSYYITNDAAASAYETWGGYCGECV